MSTDKIIQSLQHMITIHESLIHLSEQKTEMIKIGSVEKLQQLLLEETKLINKLEHAEIKRQKEVEQWFLQRDLKEQPWTITQMLEVIEEGQNKGNLEKVTTTLTNMITQLKQQEQLNQSLLGQSMQFIQLSLGMMQPSIKNLNYSKDKETVSSDRSMFDSQA